jgi:hypothetical protein
MTKTLTRAYDDAGRGEMSITGTVLAGAVSDWIVIPHPFPESGVTVRVAPGAGGTAFVETTVSPLSAVEAGTAEASAWPHGDVDSATVDVIEGPVRAVRFTATTADAVWEVLA